jgi:hypothetical protein
MAPFHEHIAQYRTLMRDGIIRQVYIGLIEYVMELKTYFKNKYPDYFVSGNVYVGYMDMTYFSIVPQTLKERNLKIAIVFLHEAFRFEIWLSGYNKQIQSKYWKFFKEKNWKKYHLVESTKNADSILEHIIVKEPDFRDLAALTKQIEIETLIFIQEVELFLTQNEIGDQNH